MKIRYAEVLRYMGDVTGKMRDDERMQALVESCAEEIMSVAAPKSVQETYPFTWREDALTVGAFTFESRDLAEFFKGAKEIILFAATLGAEVDRALQRAQVADMSRAVVLQAAAAALIEDYCDECELAIGRQANKRALRCAGRYSPGYGDFPLKYQNDLLAMLNAQKRIGLCATQSCMLSPAKSVTALIGLVPASWKPCLSSNKCSRCPNVSCLARRVPYEPAK